MLMYVYLQFSKPTAFVFVTLFVMFVMCFAASFEGNLCLGTLSLISSFFVWGWHFGVGRLQGMGYVGKPVI